MGRLRLAVWSPLPPSASGIADYVAEQLPELARRFDVTAVVEDPSAVDRAVAEQVALTTAQDMPAADLDVYHVGNSPPHAYVYRAALQRPGVLALHEWSVHHLVLRETVERGDRAAYLREMRRCHGEAGTFVGRQVARALGGDLLPALYAVNDRLLESSLAVVGLSRHIAERARLRLPGRPVLHLPHHLALPLAPLPSRAEARRTLGLPAGAAIVTAPGLATASKRLDVAVQAVARLRASRPDLRLVVAGAVEERLPLAEWAAGSGLGEGLLVTGRLSLDDFVRHLVAADVVLALRFPSHGEISGAMVRSLGVGRPVLVTAGTPGAEEFPEGVVVPVDPGPQEAQQLEALLGHLLEAHGLRESIGRLARGHIAEHHDLSRTTAQLATFFDDVHQRLESLRRLVPKTPADGLLGYLLDEVRAGTLDLGLAGIPHGVEPLLAELTGGRS